MKYFLLIVFLSNFLYSVEFEKRENRGVIEYSKLDENSGMVVGLENPDIIWAINDGKSNEIYGFDKFGKSRTIINFKKDLLNNDSDVEDIAILRIGGLSYIALADIGDNDSNRETCNILLVPEPNSKSLDKEVEIKSKDIIKIEFNYNDGARDAECLLADPISHNLYIVSKRELNARLYELKFPFDNNKTNTFQFISTFPFGNNPDKDFTGVTAGDISKDGTKILIKDYNNIWYFQKLENESIVKALSKSPQKIKAYSYSLEEPQGESVCWEFDNSGFYTASEEKSFKNFDASLYFYREKTTSIKKKESNIELIDNVLYNNSSNEIHLTVFDYLGRIISENNLNPFTQFKYDYSINQAHYLYISEYNMFYKLR